jgi:hypothetical protein
VIIIGLDYHPGMQQIALVDTETGEYLEQELHHSAGEAEKFYGSATRKWISFDVGMVGIPVTDA